MGMFDRVWTKCPACGRDLEFQSKSGPCQLRDFDLSNVPPAVVEDLVGDVKACECGAAWRIRVVLMTTLERA